MVVVVAASVRMEGTWLARPVEEQVVVVVQFESRCLLLRAAGVRWGPASAWWEGFSLGWVGLERGVVWLRWLRQAIVAGR